MLDRNVRFEGFDTEDWTRLLELMRSGPATEPEAGLIVVHQAGRVLSSYRTGSGPWLDPGEPWPQPLAELGTRASVRWVLAAQAGALDTWAARIASRIRPTDDMLDQLIMAWQQARQLAAEGTLETWPTSLASIPVPGRGVWTSALGWICPPGQSLVLAAWDADRLWTSVVLRRSDAGFDRIVGPDGMREEVEAGTPAEMWKRFKQVVSSTLGPIGAGVAGDLTVWRQVATWREPGAWARAVASGEMVLDPFPRGLTLPLALDASRMALMTVRDALGRRFGAGRAETEDGSLGAADFASLWRVAEGLWTLQRRGR